MTVFCGNHWKSQFFSFFFSNRSLTEDFQLGNWPPNFISGHSVWGTASY